MSVSELDNDITYYTSAGQGFPDTAPWVLRPEVVVREIDSEMLPTR